MINWNFKFAEGLEKDNSKRDVIFDIEANGLLETITKVWVLVAQDYRTREFYVFSDEPTGSCPKHGSLKLGVQWLASCKSVICHNIAGYDWFVLNRFFPSIWNKKTVPWKKCHDTYIQSKCQWFERPLIVGVKGNHGLAYYGQLLGYPKPVIEDWSYWDEDKLNRCIVDVEINTRTFDYLNKEKEERSQLGIDFSWQTNITKYSQFWCTIQQLNGFKADVALMKQHVETLDRRIQELADEVEPQLPKKLCVHSSKATWEEIRDKWGRFFRKVPKTEYELANRNGEVVSVPIKPAYMPTIKVFLKSGRYDSHTCKWFDISSEPSESNNLVGGPYTKVYYEDTKLTQHEQVKNFLLSLGWVPTQWTRKKDVHGNWLKDENGNFVKGSPKITEDSFDSLPEGIGKKIAEYNTLQHRRRTLMNDKDDEKGWLNQIRQDGRISTGANCFNTATGRMTQSGIVNCPSGAAAFGAQMREVWIAEKHHQLVSTDMASAQLVILAGYMEDDDFTKAVKEGKEFEEVEGQPEVFYEDLGNNIFKVYRGTDAHTLNSVYFGLNKQEDIEEARVTQGHCLIDKITKGRKKAKNGIYALLFGSGDQKFAITVGLSSAADGKRIKDNYFTRLPKLKAVIDKLESQFKKNKVGSGGYVQVAGGVWLYCYSKHKLLNYLLMGSEAILQQVALIWKNSQYEKLELGIKQVLNVHDENTDECPDDIIDHAKDIHSRMYLEASKIIKLAVPVEGTPSVGLNYLEVH